VIDINNDLFDFIILLWYLLLFADLKGNMKQFEDRFIFKPAAIVSNYLVKHNLSNINRC
jgi:hypothetical protein